jgi:glycosyltransferase involved in cell wall biosynthesis
VGNHLAALVAAWQDDPDLRGRVVLLTRCGDDPPPGLALSTRPLRGGPLWHLRAAAAVRLARGRFVSPESLIVPILLGRRATVTVHDLAALRLQAAHPVRTRVVFRSLLGLAVRRAGRVIVPSEATAAELSRSFPRADTRVVVVRNARRRLSSTAQPPSDLGRYVLFVGTLEPRKNVEVLVRAFQRVAPVGWRLVLVGAWGWLQEPERQRLEALIDADPRVEHRGFVDDEHLAGLYAGAEVFAYPSSYEGFGLPVLEAMAFGTPVIVTDTPALVEVAGGAGRLVDPADLQGSLETALAELLEDEALRRALARRSLERARLLADEERSAAARVAAVCLGSR